MSLKQINQELYSYLCQYLNDEDSVKKLLHKSNLAPFFPGVFDRSVNISALNLLKKMRFQNHVKAVAEIKSMFDENNISFVVMKGVALALDLYHEPYQRGVGDIDILVLPEQLTTVLRLLRSFGYKGNENLSAESFLSETNHEHHFPCLYKNRGMLDNIVLEVHVDIVPRWIYQMSKSYTDKILLHSHVNKLDIPVMDDCDTIVFMMLHLLKHYVYEMLMGIISGNAEAEIDLRAIHETALFIDKIKDFVPRDLLEVKISEYCTGNELKFVCRMLSDIYPSLTDFLSIDITADNRACFSSRFSEEALKIGTQKILFDDKRRLLCSVIGKLQQDAYILPCYKMEESAKLLPAHTVVMDCYRYADDNHFGTYVDVLNNSLRPECRISFYVEWSSELFWFHMTAMDKGFTFLNCNHETLRQTIGKQDYFRLHFDTGNRGAKEAFVRGIVLKPQYDADKTLRLFLKEDIMGNNAETELEQTEYISTVEYNNNICKIDVGLPWNRLGYHPRNGFTFFFDFQVWKYCEKRDSHITLTWQSAYKPWYDITTYACVKLVDNSGPA